MQKNLSTIGSKGSCPVDIVLFHPGNAGHTRNENRCEGSQKQQENLRIVSDTHPKNDDGIIAQWRQWSDKCDDWFENRSDPFRISAEKTQGDCRDYCEKVGDKEPS